MYKTPPHPWPRKIWGTFGVSVNQVRHIRGKATFKAEYARQLAIYQGSFEEVQLGHRKERVKAMDDLYHLIPQDRTVEQLVKGAMAGTVELAANWETRRDNRQVQRAQVQAKIEALVESIADRQKTGKSIGKRLVELEEQSE